MKQLRVPLRQRERWERQRRSRLVLALMVGLGGLLGASIASAADLANGQLPVRQFPAGNIFTFLFLMLGPFKIIGPFARITKDADAARTRQIALWGTLFASLALGFAAMLGERAIASYGIPLPILALAAGIIFFLVALLGILQQFAPPSQHGDDSAIAAQMPAMKVALTQLAFPTIVTPYGIAALVVFMVLGTDLQGRLTIGAILLAIMLLNLVVMLVTRHILPVLLLVLPILGAVLGVIQVALGLQIINSSLRALGVL